MSHRFPTLQHLPLVAFNRQTVTSTQGQRMYQRKRSSRGRRQIYRKANIMNNTSVNEMRLGEMKISVSETPSVMGPRRVATLSRLAKNGTDWESPRGLNREELKTIMILAFQALRWINNARNKEDRSDVIKN